MAKRDDLHVVPHSKGWAVRKPGAKRVSSTHSTQREAVDHARERLRNRPAIPGRREVVIHRRDGRIRDSDTSRSGREAFPPRDRR